MKAKINGIEMAYTDTGKGAPVLLVHGYPLDHNMWAAQTPDLAKDFRVIVPDLRGHGESEAPAGTYTMDNQADDLKALLDNLHIDKVAFCGLSMGGYVAFAFYRKYPQRVRALVLADTRPQADTPEGKQGRLNTVATVIKDGVAGVAQATTPRMLAPATAEGNRELFERVKAIMVATPPNGYIGDLRGLADRPDSTPTLSEITCPTLIIVGDQDVVTPPADARLMNNAIKGSSLVTIPNAGHLTPMEQPQAFNDAVRGFLKAMPA